MTITVQGCHEVDPKICYPPHPTLLTLDVPAGVADERATMPTRRLRAPAQNSVSISAAVSRSARMLASRCRPSRRSCSKRSRRVRPACSRAGRCRRATTCTATRARFRSPDGAGVELGAPQWPKGVDHTDEHFGTVVVYFDQVELPIPLARENGAAQTITLDGRISGLPGKRHLLSGHDEGGQRRDAVASAAELAAAKAAFVPVANQVPPSPGLRPTSPASGRGDVGASAAASGIGDVAASASASASGGQSEEQALAANLSSNRWLALLSFFGFGLLLAFTPCVFPMIPILSGIIAGSGENVTTRRAFVLSIVYVLATCVVFTIAGVVAGLAGANLQAAFQKPWILWSFRDPVRAAVRSACSVSTSCSCRVRGNPGSPTSATSRKAAR